MCVSVERDALYVATKTAELAATNMNATMSGTRRGVAQREMVHNTQSTPRTSSAVWWCHSCDAQKLTVVDESSSCGELVCSDCGSCFIEQMEISSRGGIGDGSMANIHADTTQQRTRGTHASSIPIPLSATRESNAGEYGSNVILQISIEEDDSSGSNSNPNNISVGGVPDTSRTGYVAQNILQASPSSSLTHTVNNGTNMSNPLLIHTSNTTTTNSNDNNNSNNNSEQERLFMTDPRVTALLEELEEISAEHRQLDELDSNRVNVPLHQRLMHNMGMEADQMNMWSIGSIPMPMPMPFIRSHGILGSGHNGNFVIHGQNQADGGHEFSTLEELMQEIQQISFLENSTRNANRPAAAAIVDSLQKQIIPRRSTDERDDANVPKYECCICMCDMDEGEEATKMPCGHLFHFDCIKQWLATNNTCPVCREKLATDADLDNNDDPSFH